jgi:hypothetical protein
MTQRFFKVIACEIALREICHVAARSRNLVDPEFLTQGLHDRPGLGREEIQRRIDAVPGGKYDAILVGYGLCGNILQGLQARHTPLVVPRGHDCITFFLGSKERYRRMSEDRVGTYFYTSGWLEGLRRRGEKGAAPDARFLPTRAGAAGDTRALFDGWVEKYGEERARYLLETMDEWTRHYTHGALIDFDFTESLRLEERVKAICTQLGWKFETVAGDLGLLQRWVDGDWNADDFLVVRPGEQIVPSHADSIIKSDPIAAQGPREP